MWSSCEVIASGDFLRDYRTMKITVESLGLPTLAAVIGKKTEISIESGTVADLMRHLIGRFGPKARELLLDGDGRLDLTIQVMVNEEGFLSREDLPRRVLKDGDRVRFMLLVGGG
jgi:sulfur carrier protein ThiS